MCKKQKKLCNTINFTSFGFSESIIRAIDEKGYHQPTPIQEKAIPAILDNKDIMAAAQTGTGKTASFTLPILEKLSHGPMVKEKKARVLILTPTRELAAQVADSVDIYGKYSQLSSTAVFGGVNINPQKRKLHSGVDVLIATPGRLLDLYQQKSVYFNDLEILVLDEADRMLDMGFIHDIRKILAILPKKRQTLMFSATFSNNIRQLARGILKHPLEISVTPRNTTVAAVDQCIHPVDKNQKAALLSYLIHKNNWFQALVFCRTKHGANKLTKYLNKSGITAVAIHGNKSQSARTKALADFKNMTVCILVATDIAARGLDIQQLPQVVNVDLPTVPEDYVHRIGRTGRAGEKGSATSLVSGDEAKQLKDIERLINQSIPKKIIDNFKPSQNLGSLSQKVNQPSKNWRPSSQKENQPSKKTYWTHNKHKRNKAKSTVN